MKNVASFDLRNVELHQAAVWTENGSVAFMQEGGFSGRVQAGSLQTVSVPSLRLRDQLADSVDFLKVDIEGAEFDVIRDCADRLSNVDRLFIEYHSEADKPQRLDEMLAIIRQAGFRYQIQEANVARKPFLARQTMMGMDLQLNLFCFRDTPA
ncbi:MAG: FkbM family methyltransferase [Kiritimatiellae bacterium]|nr:FkbM family methyltransferase [Kiritimatiellia bacterium]